MGRRTSARAQVDELDLRVFEGPAVALFMGPVEALRGVVPAALFEGELIGLPLIAEVQAELCPNR